VAVGLTTLTGPGVALAAGAPTRPGAGARRRVYHWAFTSCLRALESPFLQ
jgi:hypothetical protein